MNPATIIAHLHPLLVHLPIGILLVAFALECMVWWKGRDDFRPAIQLSVALGAISAALSALSGWLLFREGGYDESVATPHQYWGFFTAGIFALLTLLKQDKWRRPAFIAGVAGLIVTGHYGGTLTHGAGYLFGSTETGSQASETGTAPVRSELSPDTKVFEGLVMPVLRSKCVSCHKPEKKKGGLVLSTPEGLMAGGESGPAVVPGNPEKSELLKRIHLPGDHDDHMPPKGRPQLTQVETRLIEWWITGGADLKATLAEKPLPDNLKAAFSPRTQQEMRANPVFDKKVSPASESAIGKLRSLRLSVNTFGEGQPWLVVSFAGIKETDQERLSALDGVKEQLVDLDLSHTAVQDRVLQGMAFPHLVRLNLSHTTAATGIADMISHSPFLDVLNLTNTRADQSVESAFGSLPQLRKVYIWGTGIPAETVNQWKSKYPGISFETGIAMDNAEQMALKTPELKFGRSFFDDTAHIELEFPFKGVDIHYTLEEADTPSLQSPKYTGTIIVDKTTHVRAFAAREGWKNSPVVDAVLVKKKYTLTGSSIQSPPSPKYPAKGGASLVDGKISDVQSADTWLGYEGEHLTATLDLSVVKSVEKVFVHCLENNPSWIFKPTGIQVFTSSDGKQFVAQGSQKYSQNTGMGEQKVHLLGFTLPAAINARYVRVKVESLLKNPSWHPGKGEKCWIFVDEMMVE